MSKSNDDFEQVDICSVVSEQVAFQNTMRPYSHAHKWDRKIYQETYD